LPEDAFISIVGPNGSGKTTLLRNLLGILEPSQGTIELFGRELDTYSRKEMARKASYVPQTSRLEYDFSVYECVAMGRYAHGGRLSVLSGEDHHLIEDALEAMEMSILSDRLATELSGGEYQRMLIARALAQQSEIILLDEPVSHLDIHNQREILRLLRGLVDRKIATVVCILHDLNAVSAYSDRVVMMREGAIVAEGTVREVLTKARIESVYRIEVEIASIGDADKPLILPCW
jgi:iron complex transport system ATP-binding protein